MDGWMTSVRFLCNLPEGMQIAGALALMAVAVGATPAVVVVATALAATCVMCLWWAIQQREGETR